MMNELDTREILITVTIIITFVNLATLLITTQTIMNLIKRIELLERHP